MLMQQRLGLKLAQKPVLTQSLRQLVKLLALNKLELKEEINQELVENPLLEVGAEESSSEDSSEESESDAAEAQEESPVDPFDEIDIGAFFDDYLDSGPRGPAPEIVEKPSFETFLSSPTTLTDHLLWQLSLTPLAEDVQAAAEAVIGNLNEDGYLNATAEEIAAGTNVAEEKVRQALDVVQHFDPVGVASRDLQECLLIQLRGVDGEDSPAYAIVEKCWRELEISDTTKICECLDLPRERIEEALAVIRHLDPRPGQRYNPARARYVEPDVQFVKTQDGFRVVLNEDDMPDLRLNRGYRQLLRKGAANKDVRDYVRERYNSAIQLLRNIEQRRQTIRSVCDAVVRRQQGFLANGIEQLRPMMIKEVAEEIGVHPSTVSRAVANKYAHTPHGVYELRYFFTEGVQGPKGSTIPLLLLKRQVKKMIEEEDTRHPLTDDKISKLLREDGVYVTRRTVAKYREDLNIPSTHRRRRRD